MSRLLDLLDAAVQDCLWDEREVGCVVSGGLDSSTVVRLVQRWRDVPTFTGYYNDAGFDERRYASMVCSQTNGNFVCITPDDFVEHLDGMARAFRPPYQGLGMFGQYMVARRISEWWPNVRVVLSGEGSDELFGGYARLYHVAGEPLPDTYPPDYRPPADYPTTVEEALAYDLERLPLLLAVDDQALGHFGIEARAPFTDPRVVAYALALPPSERVAKKHLRRKVRGLVPDPIIRRTDKMGFPCPLVKWANEKGNPVRDLVGDLLGHHPDPAKPWAREWLHDLLSLQAQQKAA